MELPVTFQDVTIGILALIVLYTRQKDQSKETVGNQSIVQSLIQLFGMIGTATETIAKTLNELKDFKKSEHILIVETHQGVKAIPDQIITRHDLLKTDLNATINRFELPLTTMLGRVEQSSLLIADIHKWVTNDRAVYEKQLAIARHAKVDETPEQSEAKPVELPANTEGKAPQGGESAAPVPGDSAEVVSK